jgi:hypothetical protein
MDDALLMRLLQTCAISIPIFRTWGYQTSLTLTSKETKHTAGAAILPQSGI